MGPVWTSQHFTPSFLSGGHEEICMKNLKLETETAKTLFQKNLSQTEVTKGCALFQFYYNLLVCKSN